MKKILFVLLLLPAPGVRAQQYTRAEIQNAADSVLRTFIRPDMFAHCESDLTNDSYVLYCYEGKKGKLKFTEVPRKAEALTKGRFRSVIVRYTMKYPYAACRIPDAVKGRLYVTLDRHLDMALAPDISFIPDYVWENDSCRYRSYSGR